MNVDDITLRYVEYQEPLMMPSVNNTLLQRREHVLP